MNKVRGWTGLLILVGLTVAADDSWVGPVGVESDWNVGANWASGFVPDAEIAFVDNGGYAVMSSGTVFNNGTVAISQGSSWNTVRIEAGASLFNTKVLVSNAGSGRGVLLINGGSIDTSTKDFVLGQNSASATGVVVMSGGEVTARNFNVGYNGTGFFTLSNGIFRTQNEGIVGRTLLGEFVQEGGTNSYDNGVDLYLARYAGARGTYTLNGGTLLCTDFMYLGYAGQAEGVLTVNGGTLITSNNVVIGAAAGGNGTVTVNGGNGNWQYWGPVLRVGYGSGSTGTLTMNGHTNVFNSMNVGDNAGSTGRVGLTACDLVISNGVLLGGDSGRVGVSGGRLAVLSGGLTVGGTSEGMFTASNGAVLSANSMAVSASGRLKTVASDVRTADLSVSGSAQLQDSTAAATNAAGNAVTTIGYGGQMELDGGTLTLNNLVLSSGATQDGPPAFRMTDGLFIGTARTTLNGGTPFVQTGGVVSNKEFYVYGSSNSVVRFEISGGTFTLASPNNFALFNSGGAEFLLKGSAPSVAFNRFSYVGGAVKQFLMTFMLDKSPSHLAPVHLTGTDGYRCGHLRVGIDGGAALMRTNSFALLAGVKSTAYNFLSRPDADMWAESLVDQTSRVTLASGYKAAALSMGGTVEAGAFAPMPMGHVEVSNLNTFRLVELNIRLTVQEGAKTLSQVVDDFVAAGYTNSVVESDGDYNVKLVIPADCVADRSSTPVSYFAWDFTRTDSITNLETVVTNAAVTGLKLEYTRLPSLGTLISIN